MPVHFISILASAWGVVMAVSPVLQIIRMVRRHSSDDVSLGYFAILIPGFLLWVAHGFVTNDPYLIVPNSVAVVISITLIVIALRLRKGHREEQAGMQH